MKPKPLMLTLAAAGLLVAGVVLLLLPEDDEATPGGTRTAQEQGPEGLPEFRADLGEGRPAEPLVAPGADIAVDRATTAAAQRDWRTVSGTVVRSSDGSPLQGASVKVVLQLAPTITDEQGRFQLNAPPDASWISVWLAGAWGPERSLDYALTPGAGDIDDLRLVFDSGFSITGVVLDESGGRLPGGVVDVNRVVEERSDENGQFVFRDVAPEAGVASLRVSARAPGHTRAGMDVLVPRDSSQTIHVELRLSLGGAIAGRVTASRGTPLEDVLASVAFVMTSEHGEQAPGGLYASSDEHGDYLIDNVPEGRYVVEVGYGAGLARSGGELPTDFAFEIPGPLTISTGDVQPSVGAQVAKQLIAAKGLGLRWFTEVVVQAGQTTRLDVELFPPAALSGRVLDEAGAPVEGALVTLERIERWPIADPSGSTISTSDGLVITSKGTGDGKGETELAEVEGKLQADASGNFEFSGLMEGEKRLSVSAPGLAAQTRTLVLQRSEVRTGEDFVLERGLTVRGRVRDVTGAPIEGASLEIKELDADHYIGGERSTDAEGRFEIGGLKAGPKQLIVFKSGFKSVRKPVAPGGPELELTLTPSPQVIGIVTHAVHGGAITHFDVSVAYENSTWNSIGGTYPEGRFEMPIDDDTLCKVTVRSGGFREVVVERVLPSRTMLEPLQIRLQPE